MGFGKTVLILYALLCVTLFSLYGWYAIDGCRYHPKQALDSKIEIGNRHRTASDHKHITRHGAVASESMLCTQIGIDLLERGGSAADALVGTSFCVGVIGMQHSGIGGGGFTLIRHGHEPDGDIPQYETVDYRETAPAAAHRDMFQGNLNGSIFGGLAVAVPGEVLGMAYLHRQYGKLPWRDVLHGAITVARDGFPMTQDLARYINITLRITHSRNFFVEDPNWAMDFAPNGTLLEVGETMTRKRYADTLQAIADDGPQAFYQGRLAQSMINTIRAANGSMSMDDLRHYKVKISEPLQISYRDYKVTCCAAPASGAVALSALKIIEGYTDIGDSRNLNLSVHRLDEALRFAYGQRTVLGDPAYLSGMPAYEQHMLSPSTAADIRSRISDTHTHNASYYNPSNYAIQETAGTSHIVATDASGMSLSTTTTINLLFGAQLLDPLTGVILNDEMNDFSIPDRRNEFGYVPSHSNFIAPGKRPFSSITPVIVEHSNNNSVALITGAAGGSRIISATVLELWNVLDRKLALDKSLEVPRFHDQLVPYVAAFEEAWKDTSIGRGVLEFMRNRGHNVSVGGVAGLSTVHAIAIDGDGGFQAAAEPRLHDSGGLTI